MMVTHVGQSAFHRKARLTTLTVLMMAASLLFSGLAGSSATAHELRKSILVLHAYSTDFAWTNNSNNGILDVLHREAPDYRIRTEFMDTKNIYTPEYIAKLVELYSGKYAMAQPDGIIATDNNAMAFLETYGPTLFPHAIAVATGINNASPPPAGSFIKTIVPERVNHEATLRNAIKLMPKTRNIYVIPEATPSGEAILEEVKQAANNLQGLVNITPVLGMPIEQLEHFAATRQHGDMLYILPFLRSADGHTFRAGDVEQRLAELSPAPVVASWQFQIGNGVLGGNTVSARSLGSDAVYALLGLLRNEPVPAMYSNSASYTNVYDFNVINRFGINLRDLPPKTIFLNKPKNFLERNEEAIAPVATIILILSLTTLLLYQNLIKQRQINVDNQKIMYLDKEVIETQRELVTTLGEVIEVRSQETGNHVKRVAKLSRMLGEKVGLSEQELNILEAASPLHDVGKIGIPESILHKPDTLTDAEFDIIKSHTDIGRAILAGSNRELLKASCEIAHEHHERWDGSGYPRGLAGEDISLFARITTLADVYDALMSDRCYKKAWSEEKTLDYIYNEKGRTFDPMLVTLFLANVDEARAIRQSLPNDTDEALHHHSAPRHE